LDTFTYEATVTRVGGPDGRPYGLIFREGSGRYYVFGVYPSGRFYMSRWDPDRREYPRVITDRDSTAIRKGNTATNTLRVEATGSTFRLFANGQFLAEATDTTHPRGNIGIWVGGKDVHIAVSSVKVTR
jgi:hypothetical protein